MPPHFLDFEASGIATQMKSKHAILSLNYHKAIAQKIRENPSLIQIAIHTLDRFREMNGGSCYSQRWADILKRDVNEVCNFLESESEYADDLRHSSVFTGILTRDERLQVWSRTFGKPTPKIDKKMIDKYWANEEKPSLPPAVEHEDIEQLFIDAVHEFGFHALTQDLSAGPNPIAQQMQPVSNNPRLRIDNKKGRLVATQGEYELVTFNVPRCAERLKMILLDAYKSDISKIYLRKYAGAKLQEDLGL